MSISDLLNSVGGKSFKFDQIGATITGTVENAEVVQKKNFDSGEPEVWSDGSPVQQIRVALKTTQRDPSDPEDDGTRNIYIKGWGDQLRELRRAIKAAGAADLENGGTFTATYVRDGELPAGKRGFPPKVYAYEYRKPSGTAGLLAEQPVQQPAPAPQAAPAPAAQPQPTAEQIAAYQAYMATQQPQG